MTVIPTNFDMFTPEGNVAAAGVMATFIDSLTTRPVATEDEAYLRLSGLIEEASKTHGEIYDTEVRHAMTYILVPIWRNLFGVEVDQWRIG